MHQQVLEEDGLEAVAMVSRHADERRQGLAVAEMAMWPYRGAAEGRDGTRG
jgi:hypothetical protein